MKTQNQEGSVNLLIISSVMLGILVIALSGVSIWAFSNYLDQKNNVDSKISVAVSEAKKSQATLDQKKFIEQEKLPTRLFTGPSDFGSVTFSYPKTWSIYVASSGASSGIYSAYLNPAAVPPIDSTTPFAVRVEISSKTYESILRGYESDVERGDLVPSPLTTSGVQGIRLDGTFSKINKGSKVVFKVRDKTLILSTDGANFKSDFDNIILKSLSFKP
jgi:hypothetical protein